MVPAAHSHARVLPDLALRFAARRPSRCRQIDRLSSSGANDHPLRHRVFIFSRNRICLLVAFVPGGNPDPRLTWNVFYFLFAHHEPSRSCSLPGLVLSVRSSSSAVANVTAATNADVALGRRFCPAAAVIVFAIAAIGTSVVFHDYLLTADEYLADFQAKIFLRGKIQAEVPPEWVNVVGVIRPTYVDYFPADSHNGTRPICRSTRPCVRRCNMLIFSRY